MKALLLLIAMPALVLAAPDDPRALLRGGKAAYQAQDYERAATNFARAAAAAAANKLDPAVARFNEGNALAQSGHATEAGMAFEQALRTADLGLQGRAYYNRGNALMADAQARQKSGKFDDALHAIDEALAMYERSMLLDARDRDPKLNHEIAMLRREQVEEQKKQQEQQQQKQDQKQDQQDQNKDQQQQKDQNQKQDPSQQNEQKNDQGDKDRQGEQQQKKDQQDQGEKQHPQPDDQQAQDQQEGQQGEPRKADRLTPQEAALLLDAMKQDEQAQRRQIGAMLMRNKAGREQPVDKDW